MGCAQSISTTNQTVLTNARCKLTWWIDQCLEHELWVQGENNFLSNKLGTGFANKGWRGRTSRFKPQLLTLAITSCFAPGLKLRPSVFCQRVWRVWEQQSAKLVWENNQWLGNTQLHLFACQCIAAYPF